MKTTKLLLILISLFSLFLSALNAQIKRDIKEISGREVKNEIWHGKQVQFAKGVIAVKITASATQKEIAELLKTIDGKIINPFDKLGWGLIELPDNKDEILAIDNLSKLPFVLVAEPNMVISTCLEPNDPYFQGTSPATYAYQWALKNTGQTPPAGTSDADIDAPEAWNISTGNSDVIIAILDSGIPMLNNSLSHPDLDDANKIILGPDYVNDGNSVMDKYGHGTHVAGIAAAESNNSTGIAGVAWNCKIMVIQVFGEYGGGYWSYFYNGVVYAVDYQRNNPGKKVIINFSGGGDASQQGLDAVVYANTYGVPIVASAGNEEGGSVLYPARYSPSYSNVIAVSSTDATDTFSSFSSQGSQVCVSAPGGYGGYWDGNVLRFNGPSVLGKNIYSTTPNYTFNLQIDPFWPGDPYSTDITQDYGYMPGTSMAAPHVSGIAALLLSINPDLTPSQIRNIIQQSAEDKGTVGFDNYYGYGRVNAYKALKYTLEHYGGTLTSSFTILSGETWTFQSGVTVNLNGYNITSSGGIIAIESGATFTPDIRLKSGSTVLGLYTSLDAAYADGSDVEIRGTHTFTDYYTVSTGRILRAESGSELRFPPGKYLNVYGTLHGNQADFMSTSGTWGGIRYRSAGSGTLDHCTMNHATYGIRSTSTSTSLHFTHNTINGCSYGIYCSSSSPEIRDNTISNSSGYGVYLYNSSPELESNRISGSKVYLNNSDAVLENNLITGAYGNEAVYFYASSPELYYNTISTENAFWALHATHGSDPVFGGPYTGNGTNYGYNALSTGFESDGVICASNGSVPWLGYGGYGAGYYGYGGNAILGGGLYPAAAMDATSCIFADWCWWGQTPAPPCYGDVTTYDPLSSDPGTGSTLSKSSTLPVMASHPEEKPGDEAAKALWEVAMSAVWEKNYTGALDDFQTLIRLYPASNYAYRALSMSVRLCREQKPRDMLTYLDELLTGVEDQTLRAVIKSRKVSEYRRMKEPKQAIALSREILAENPETIHETTALFDLFNLYQKDLADSVQAAYYVTELKTKYPEDELTGIARIDCGEDPEKVVIRKRTLPGQEEELLPEAFTLGSAYPNPFNPVTRLTYSLPDAGDLVFEVVDITGRIVDRITFTNQPAGEHHFDYTASHLSTGLYIIRARYDRQVQIRKIVYMK